MKAIWIGFAMFALGSGAAAQKIYRCGPDGRIYQQAPCSDGKAIDASDPRTPEQRAEAQAIAASEARRAAQFDRDNAPASAPEGRKPKLAKAPPTASEKAASGATPTKAKLAAQDPSRPLTVRLPAKPKAPASAASQ